MVMNPTVESVKNHLKNKRKVNQMVETVVLVES